MIRFPLAIAALAAVSVASAQPSAPEGPQLSGRAAVAASATTAGEAGSELTVYLLTMGPGDEVWERFGHNAIWIHDELNGTDIAYHWGLFDFADKEFVPRFIQGRMRYSMGAFDLAQTIDAYRNANRTVWSQKLNLSPAQRRKLADFVAWNILPENRFYRYDYFRDNCSTRVRDAIDMALGGPIRKSTEGVPSGTTYRSHTERLTQDDWPVFTGTMIGLGEPVDRPIDVYEEMFLPVRMMERIKTLRVPGASGSEPLVLENGVLFQATRAPEDASVRRGMLGYLLIAAVILALWFGLFMLGRRDGRMTGVLLVAITWSVMAGLAGVLLTGLWGFTDHLYSYRNENVLQLNPVSLLTAVALIQFLWALRKSPALRPSRFLTITAIAASAFSIAGFVLQVLPSFTQGNGDVIALAMPLHVGLAAVVVALAMRSESQSSTRR